MSVPRCDRCGMLILGDGALYSFRAQRGMFTVCGRCWAAKGRRPIASSLIPAENSTLKPPAAPKALPPAKTARKFARKVA